MTKRKINFSIFKKWASGKENPPAELALAAKCSITMARELINGVYKNTPLPVYRAGLCKCLGVSEDKLFPLIEEEGSA